MATPRLIHGRPCRIWMPPDAGLGDLPVVGDRVRGRDLRALVVLERALEPEQVRPDPDDDPVEHDRRDHLVRAHGGLEEAGDPGEHRAGEHGRDDGEQDERHRGEVDVERYFGRDDDGRGRAGEVLALAADVEEPAAEREGDRDPGEHERHPHEERLLELDRRAARVLARLPREEPVEPSPLEDRPVGLDRVPEALRRREDDDTGQEEGEQRRQERRDEASGLLQEEVAPERALGARLLGRQRGRLCDRGAHATWASRRPPPVIATPSSSSVAVGGNSPANAPS